MKFCEAMELLQSGGKVSRHGWKDSVYFKVIDNEVKSFQPTLKHFVYNDDIMISDGWLIEASPNEYKFCEIIPFLQQGSKAKLKEWDETFIYLDKATKSLLVQCMDQLPFIPDFESFTAIDWVEVP